LKGVSGPELARQLKGQRFESSRRHGKHLFVRAKDDIWLRLHFGMTGSLRYFKKEEKRRLGPDALDVNLSAVKKMLAKHRGAVKSLLMNQRLIAGIVNIYADEVLFRSRIHPAAQTAHLGEKRLKRLFHAMRHVLEKAIESQVDVDRMPTSWLLPHRGKGVKCPRCGRELQSSKIGGRTAWFCSHCQKRTP
jgi:formamidopyrimidine-DNA glycosylase